MDDEQKQSELKEILDKAILAFAEGAEGWQGTWADALEATGNLLSKDCLAKDIVNNWSGIALLVSRTAEMVRDEADGSKPHFWIRPSRRPKLSLASRERQLALAILVAGCAAKKRRKCLSESAISMAQRELRMFGYSMTEREIATAYSNSNKLPTRERLLLKEQREELRMPHCNPDHIISFACESLHELDYHFRR